VFILRLYSDYFDILLHRHFQATDSKKFLEMWLMNEAQAKDLIEDVLNEDRIIHEQQLGLPWGKPQL
jgi:dynein regulatory complex protein 1